jgi:hypothetical protein
MLMRDFSLMRLTLMPITSSKAKMSKYFSNSLNRLLFTFFCWFSLTAAGQCESTKPLIGPSKSDVSSLYPWKKNILTTVFWIGNDTTTYDSMDNFKSAWDGAWTQNYGGTDDPIKRVGFLPKKFAATLNPFYVALPFNDLKYPELAKKYMPWYKEPPRGLKQVSKC